MLSRNSNLAASPWVIVCSAAMLLVVMVVMTIRNVNREKQHMAEILLEKGHVLIKAVEAGARTGMRGRMGGGRQVQTLLEETALLPDLLSLEILSKKGIVLASSDRTRVGSREDHRHYLERMATPSDAGWQLREPAGGRRAFMVYRYFKPVRGMGSGHMGQMMRMQKNRPATPGDWCSPSETDTSDQLILVALDPSPFEKAQEEDIRNFLIQSGILLAVALAGFVSLFWMQRYRTTRRSLQNTSAFADEMVASLPVGLIATDGLGKIVFTNAAAERITGLDLAAARGADAGTFLPDHFCGLKTVLDAGGTVTENEMECEFSPGHVVPVSVSASRIINEEGEQVGRVLILKDLGEVRRLQEEVRRKEKMAAVGELAAGVAHEIRNPLSSIKGIATYFKERLRSRPEDSEAAVVMIREVDRLNRVISELLAFSHPARLERTPTDLTHLLAHTARLVQTEAERQGVTIDLPDPDGTHVAHVDADRLTQCLLNLFINAIQAMQEGGRLSARAIRQDGGVAVEIRDTGCGIPPAELSKVFDPYYTTKPGGTGLGLAIVHKIVEAHGGRVKVRSSPGDGTVVTLFLPRTDSR
jgi:two-component system sensor histidine kinase HydH